MSDIDSNAARVAGASRETARSIKKDREKQSVNRATLLQVRAERGSAERNRSLMFHAMQSARNRLQNAVRLRLGCVPRRTA
jgi:hypothetical protein